MTRREAAYARATELGIPFDRYTRVADLEDQIKDATSSPQPPRRAERLSNDPMGGSYPHADR